MAKPSHTVKPMSHQVGKSQLYGNMWKQGGLIYSTAAFPKDNRNVLIDYCGIDGVGILSISKNHVVGHLEVVPGENPLHGDHQL